MKKNKNLDTSGIDDALSILDRILLGHENIEENDIRNAIIFLENLRSEIGLSGLGVYNPDEDSDFKACVEKKCEHILPFRPAKRFNLPRDSDYDSAG